MKHISHILLLVSVLISATIRTQAQNLPMACAGSVEKYGVKGYNGYSDFTWKITDPSGVIVPPSSYTLFGRGDSIQIHWGDNFTGGIYTFSVVENTDYGCTGEPYEQNIMLNSSTMFIPFEGVPTSIAVCLGDTAYLNPGNFKNYLWQDGSTKQIYATTQAGTYKVRLTDQTQSCSYDTIEAKINPLPMVWLGNDTVLFGNQTLLLDASNPNLLVYQWSTGDILPSITVTGQAGIQNIWVKVTDENSCKNSDTIRIRALDYSQLRIPSAFTPNGDGINDKWYFPAPPRGSDLDQDLYPYLDDVEVHVFNRWGKLVWEANHKFVAWDGKDMKGETLPMDSYHYLIKLKSSGKTYVYKGSITIVR